MMCAGLGPMELLIILGICVLLFGASKIPQLGKSLGSSIRGFRDAVKAAPEEPQLAAREREAEMLPDRPGPGRADG